MSWNDEPDYTPQPPRWFIVLGVVVFTGLVLLMSGVFKAEAKSFDEGRIQACACEGLKQEVRTKASTYVDCVSDTHAIEIEATQDWAEAIGQSLHYAVETGKRAKVLFFCEREDSVCLRHRLTFESTIAAHNLPIDWDYVPERCVGGLKTNQEH